MPLEKFPGLQTFLGGALLVVVFLSSIALGANRPISWSLLSFAIFGLFIAQLALGFFNTMPMQGRKMVLPIGLYLCVLAWAIIQLVPGVTPSLAHPVWSHVPNAAPRIGADPGNGHHMLMRFAAYGMVFWIALRTAVNTDRAALMLKAIAIYGTLMSAYAIYALFVGTNLVVPFGLVNDVAQGTYVNRNSFATLAVIGALANIAVALDMSRDRRASRDLTRRVRDTLEFFFGGAWIYGIGTILCIGAVALTQSRGGGLAGIVGIAVLLATWRGRGRSLDPVLLGTMAVVLGFIGLTSATGFAERLLASDTETARFIVYPAIVSGILDRPILGHGIGSFWDAFRPYLPLDAAIGEWDYAHNSFLENLFELGLLAGGALYVALGLITYRLWLATVRRKGDRAFPCFAIAVVAGAGFHSIFDFPVQMPATAALFAIVLGLGVGQGFSRTEIKSSVLKTS